MPRTMPLGEPTPPLEEIWSNRFSPKAISTNPAIAILDVERNELAATWKSFGLHIPAEDRVVWEKRPQTARDLQALVLQLQAAWSSSPKPRIFNHASALCDQFLATLESHASLLAILPDSAIFHTPLLYGVLQSVVKAASNYSTMMEGLITALLDMDIAVQAMRGNKDPVPVESVAKVYSLIYLFLTEFMDWYVRRSTCQLLNSHGQDTYSVFRPLASCIQRQATTLTAPADAMDLNSDEPVYSPRALWEESQLSQLGRVGDDRRHAAQNTMTRRLIWDIQQDAEKRSRLREMRDHLLTDLQAAVGPQLHPIGEQNNGAICMTATAPDLVTPQFEWSRGSKRRIGRLELQSESKHLQAFFDSDDQISDLEPDAKIVVEGSVIQSMYKWSTSPRSHSLAIGGPLSTATLSPVGFLSACYTSCARMSQLPVISHFCALPTQPIQGQTLREQGIIALAYSLIRQLIDLLPTMVDSDALLDLSAERFRTLDGTLATWAAALSLIDTLLHFSPPLLICIIDGIDVIHDASTDVILRELIRVLLTHTRHQPPVIGDKPGPAFLFKVLFTVAGRIPALIETMSESDLILNESVLANEPSTSDAVLTTEAGAVMMNA
ncbi:hypothetical protein N7495_000135 [Penicillium taxi]|uniref:uncharacterized protein n=1 Tax=Penicillium taxi TaxID=168475 RepID=UPI0025459F6D|nr:uncharacterized protein N7495_000135 [Penicillium taxi]KAJ5907453.1 hypothetical protein N7495_000135 [Penicillium taxi]